MDIRKILAVGALIIVAAGGAYYFLVYEPESQEKAAAVASAAKKPQPAGKPAPQQAGAASGVPGAASGKQQLAASAPASAPTPTPTPTPTVALPAQPEFALETPAPKRAKAKPKRITEPELAERPAAARDQEVKLDSRPEDVGKEAPPQPQEALRGTAPASGETEAAPAAPVEPAPAPTLITPKYNDIVTAVLRGDREAVKELLDFGWWVDKPSASGITPLMAAVMNRDAPMVQLLLEHGAEPTAQALKLARKNKDAATASLLEQKGAR